MCRTCSKSLSVELARFLASIGPPRGSRVVRDRKPRRPRVDEAALTSDIIRLAEQYGRYGYRRITALLRREDWTVNAKRAERIWRREGLKVPKKQPKRGRLWFNDGSCVRLRPQHKKHVWSYDFVADRTHDGRAFRMLTIIDEHMLECLAIHVQRRLRHDDVLAVLTELLATGGHCSEMTQAAALLAGFKADHVLADKGYDGRCVIDAVNESGAMPVIPSRKNARKPRQTDMALYKERNIVDRFFGYLKQFRRVATRYDKHIQNYMGFVYIAAIKIWLK